MEIYLIRHTSVDVPAGYAYGQTDVPLKPTFEEEAEEVKKGLSDHTFDKVWTSPLTRCVRLANYCGFPEAEREDRIKEAWFKDWVNNPTPNGESLQDQYDRVSDFLNELRKSGLQKVCLFAHGGVLTCARVYAGEYPLQDAFKNVPSYGAIVKLVLD